MAVHSWVTLKEFILARITQFRMREFVTFAAKNTAMARAYQSEWLEPANSPVVYPKIDVTNMPRIPASKA